MKNDSTQSKTPLTLMERSQGYEAFYHCGDLMTSPEFHCHDFYEFYIHIRGGQYYSLDNGLYMLKPNQLYIIPPFYMHGLYNITGLTGYERAYVNVSLETLKALGCGQLDFDQRLRAYTALNQYSFQLSEQVAGQCVDLIRQIEQGSPAADGLDELQNFNRLMLLMITIFKAISQSNAVSGNVISNSIIQEVLTYINNHYTQPLKVDELARRFNVSVSYLSHEFMKFTNRSVYDYILYRRVMLSRQMMQGDASLNDIAYQCGFNDYSNFLRVFNKIIGVSPSAYRKQLTKTPKDIQFSSTVHRP